MEAEEADYAEPEPPGRLPSLKTFTLLTLALLAVVAALTWMGFILWGFVKALGNA
jgi:hypothetical protein